MEMPMDPSQIEVFRIILNKQLEQLCRQARTSREELASGVGQEAEYLDQASASTDQAMQLRFRTRESHLIRKLQLALERIENGTYGECEICGEPISLKRLEARPVTTKCFDCKEAEERVEALFKKACIHESSFVKSDL